MKWLLLSLFALAATSAKAQVFFGTVPQQNINDWKLTPITFGNHPNITMLVNGMGGDSLATDVNTIRPLKKVYNYSELAEKIDAPDPAYLPAVARVPFLLMPPPAIKMPERGRRNTGC